MATYIMHATSDRQYAIQYFDKIFLPIQQLIDFDILLNQELEKHLQEVEPTTEIDESEIPKIEPLLDYSKKMLDYINQKLSASHSIGVYNNENELKRSYILLLEEYRRQLSGTFNEIVFFLQKEEENEYDFEMFNQLLIVWQSTLDKALEGFYTIVSAYALRYGIELNENAE